MCDGADLFLNLALCALGFLPGLFHAWYIISKYPDTGYEQVSQEERVVYVVHGTQYGTVHPNGQFPGQQAGTGNAFVNAQPKRSAAKMATPASDRQGQAAVGSSSTPAAAEGAEAAAANSSHDPPPPTYADAIKGAGEGDHKIQHD